MTKTDKNNFDFLVEDSAKSKRFTFFTVIVIIFAVSISVLGFFLHYIIGTMGILLGLGMIRISMGYGSSVKRFSKRSGLTNRHY